MPRQPSGKPRGRPTGTGTLGEQTRLTVRIPTELYHRLEAFAERRRYTRGTPQLSGCVRDALEHYLVCLQRQQISQDEAPSAAPQRQTEKTVRGAVEPPSASSLPGDADLYAMVSRWVEEHAGQARQCTG